MKISSTNRADKSDKINMINWTNKTNKTNRVIITNESDKLKADSVIFIKLKNMMTLFFKKFFLHVFNENSLLQLEKNSWIKIL